MQPESKSVSDVWRTAAVALALGVVLEWFVGGGAAPVGRFLEFVGVLGAAAYALNDCLGIRRAHLVQAVVLLGGGLALVAYALLRR